MTISVADSGVQILYVLPELCCTSLFHQLLKEKCSTLIASH